jgi:chitinase
MKMFTGFKWVLASIVLMTANAYAYDCQNLKGYRDRTHYETQALVKNVGSAYECIVGGWCTIGGPYAPGQGWAWDNAWKSLGQCDGSTPSSATTTSATTTSATTTSVSKSSTPRQSSVANTASCSGIANWSGTAIYTGGMQVGYNNKKYQAKWWTQNENPADHSSTDAVWKLIGNCDQTTSSTPLSSAAPSSKAPLSSIANSVSSIKTSSSASSKSSSSTATTGGKKVIGYFTQWGVYGRNYHVKNIATSGSADKLTHIVYAFGNVTNGQCVIGDSYADYDKFYSAADSVDGNADSWDAGALRGSFNQLRKLKKMYPHIKVVWSFGGWTWSSGFGQAAANATSFANSCYGLVKDPRWADVFDGIDIDWEYPNECGNTCDTSGFSGYKNLMQALRARFGNNLLVTSAIGAGPSKINAADYAGAAQYLDFYMVMTYDYFGAFAAQGPTAPHSPLYEYPGIPQAGFASDVAVQLLKSKGIPASKILLGVGFYGRGWTGVSQAAPGGAASGAAQGAYEPGINDYKVLKNSCPATGTIAGTAYAKCGSEWWSYDTPQTLVGKMDYVNQQNLGGTFFWELSGDTANGELINVLGNLR